MDLDARYGTSQNPNIFGIRDKKMKKAIGSLQGIMTWKNRRAVYQQCFDTVMDITPYYSWLNEIQKVRMK